MHFYNWLGLVRTVDIFWLLLNIQNDNHQPRDLPPCPLLRLKESRDMYGTTVRSPASMSYEHWENMSREVFIAVPYARSAPTVTLSVLKSTESLKEPLSRHIEYFTLGLPTQRCNRNEVFIDRGSEIA